MRKLDMNISRQHTRAVSCRNIVRIIVFMTNFFFMIAAVAKLFVERKSKHYFVIDSCKLLLPSGRFTQQIFLYTTTWDNHGLLCQSPFHGKLHIEKLCWMAAKKAHHVWDHHTRYMRSSSNLIWHKPPHIVTLADSMAYSFGGST